MVQRGNVSTAGPGLSLAGPYRSGTLTGSDKKSAGRLTGLDPIANILPSFDGPLRRRPPTPSPTTI